MNIRGHEVYFKSSASMDEVEDESITLVVTSPPYWNVRDYDTDDQIGYQQGYDDYIASLNEVWSECLRVLQPNGKIAINVQPLPIPSSESGFGYRVICNIMHNIESFFRSHDCFLSGMLYWNKAPFINNVSWGSYPKPTNIATNTSFEQIFTFVKRGKTRKIRKETMDESLLGKNEWRHWAVRCIWDDIAPVIKINSKGENLFGHSAPFPVDLPYRLVRMHTAKGERVLDPFLGSGTTLVACNAAGRRGIGYEINEDYKRVIEESLTGDWVPPRIESHYKSIGNETMAEILRVALSQKGEGGDEGAGASKKEIEPVLKALKRELPATFSPAFLKNVKKHLGE